MRTLYKRQKGVALISVLLVFALVTLLAGEIMSRNFVDLRKTSHLIRSKQAYYYALGAEEFARQILYRDFEDDKGPHVDNLSESWAKENEGFAIENGSITISITDLHSKLNLNNIIDSNDRIDTKALEQFRDLLSTTGVNTAFSEILRDWLDSDTAPVANGAEDSAYAKYLTANQPMADRSELRLLKGLTFQDYDRLKPLVVALPATIKYNINTLDKELIKSLSTNITDSEVAAIVKQQQQGGYNSVGRWLSAEGRVLSNNASLLAVASEYFEINVQVTFDDRKSTLRTHLHRDPDNGKITIIKRLNSNE
jgi:general secretion pathway protein K